MAQGVHKPPSTSRALPFTKTIQSCEHLVQAWCGKGTGAKEACAFGPFLEGALQVHGGKMATWTRVLGRTIRLAPTAVGTATRGLIHSTGIKQHGWQRVACVAADTAPLLCAHGSGRRTFSSTSPTATAPAGAPSSAEVVMTAALRTALGATHVEVIDMSGG